jgi:hypothetical protein
MRFLGMRALPRRRIVLLTILILVLGLGLWTTATSNLERKALSLPIGATPAEVETVLGPPALKASGASGTHYLYGRVFMVRRGLLNTVGKWLGWTVSTQFDDWPVYLHFDQRGRLTRIKAGDELIW